MVLFELMYGTTRYSKGDICSFLILVFSVIIIANFGSISTANAASGEDNLTKVFDCIKQKANERSNLSLVDTFVCYDKELPGASIYSAKPYQNPDLSNLGKVQMASFDTSVKANKDNLNKDKSDAKTTSMLTPSDNNSSIYLSQDTSNRLNELTDTNPLSKSVDTISRSVPQIKLHADSSDTSIDSTNPQIKSHIDRANLINPSDLIPIVLPF